MNHDMERSLCLLAVHAAFWQDRTGEGPVTGAAPFGCREAQQIHEMRLSKDIKRLEVIQHSGIVCPACRLHRLKLCSTARMTVPQRMLRLPLVWYLT